MRRVAFRSARHWRVCDKTRSRQEPTAVEAWRCGDAPGPDLTVFVFAGDAPAGRLERGDAVEPAQRLPTAGGARYEGSFGVSFEQDGDAGRLEWPQGTVLACVRG